METRDWPGLVYQYWPRLLKPTSVVRPWPSEEVKPLELTIIGSGDVYSSYARVTGVNYREVSLLFAPNSETVRGSLFVTA